MTFSKDENHIRLSDRILYTLDLALEQKDVVVSEHLLRALEVSMTRFAGGKDFIDRRDYADDIKDMNTRLENLKESER